MSNTLDTGRDNAHFLSPDWTSANQYPNKTGNRRGAWHLFRDWGKWTASMACCRPSPIGDFLTFALPSSKSNPHEG